MDFDTSVTPAELHRHHHRVYKRVIYLQITTARQQVFALDCAYSHQNPWAFKVLYKSVLSKKTHPKSWLKKVSLNNLHRAVLTPGLNVALPKFCRELQPRLISCMALQCLRKLQEWEKLALLSLRSIPHLLGKYNPGTPAFTAGIKTTSCYLTEWGVREHITTMSYSHTKHDYVVLWKRG